MASESGAVQALMHKFLALLRNYREPVTDAEVREYFQSENQGEYEKLPSVLNVLMSEGKIKIFQKGNVLSYGVIGAEEAERIRGLTLEQRLVLQEIERAGNKGIWTRDIKTHTNIPQQIVTKTLRLLETRRLVKSVKSISSKNKKLYMLFDLVPSAEITGGPWYNEQEFDHVFIDTLSTFVYEVIKASGTSTLNAITDKVHASGISKVALGPEEIRSIIQTLMYDGRVEEVRAVRLTPGASHETKYKVSHEISTFNFLSETPCGVCPVFSQCQEGNIISPRSCLYITKWGELKDLEFYEREEDCIISEAMDREHEHAAAPSLSLLRVNATTDNNSNNSNQTGEVRHSSAQLSGAASAHDARERAIPMTPVLLASFPSQMQQTHHGAESPYPSGLNSGSNYPLRLGVPRERQTPQLFTAAPLLSQFYTQPPTPLLPSAVSSSHSHQQHHQQHSQHDQANHHEHHHHQSDAPLRGRSYESYRFPSDAATNSSINHHRQQQQQLRMRRLSHFELRGDETSPLLATISAQAVAPSSAQIFSNSDDQQQQQQQETAAPPAKKRKKTAFRLRNFLCMHPGCGKSFTDNAHLRDHTFVHTGEKSLSCELCGKSFARLSTLHDHQRVHSGERPYSCSQPGCEKRYSSRAALRFHIAGHASTRRGAIDASTTTRSLAQLPLASDSLMLHRSSAHDTRRSPVLQPTTQQHHRNEVASPPALPLIANDTLYLHAKIQTQQTQIAELQAELQKLKRKAKKRPVPSSLSTSAASVSRARTAAAPPMVAPVLFLMDGIKPFQCFVCYQRFANFFQLSFHAKQHPDAVLADVTRTQEPMPVGPKYCPETDCEYAEKSRKPLKNLQTLKRHWQRRHQLARPYVCTLCPPSDPKTFKTKENLKAHEKDCKGGGGGGGARSDVRQEQLVEAT